MVYSGNSYYVNDGKEGYVSGKNTTFFDVSGRFGETKYTPDGGKQYVSTYYHNGSATETYTSSYSGK